MEQPTFGKVITGPPRSRDAIHVACIEVTAACRLHPGERVSVTRDKELGCTASNNSGQPVGIIDPFLTHEVLPGWRVWLFLFPGTVTGIRHAWSHPAIEDET